MMAVMTALLALVLAGCGGGDGTSGESTAKLLRETFGTQHQVQSGRLALAVDVKADGIAGLPSPLRISLDGPFQSVKGRSAPKFDFELGLDTRDGSVKIGAISTGTKSWLKIGTRAFTLEDNAFDGLVSGGEGKPAGVNLASFGVDPRRWLRGVRNLGAQDLKGERVIHLRGNVDSEPLIEDLEKLLGRTQRVGGSGSGQSGSGITDAQRRQLVDAVTGADVDIWTGEKDHNLRRIAVDVKLEPDGGQPGTIRLDLAVSQLNREQPIGPPANPRPISELNAALASLAAQGSAAGSGPATGSPSGGASSGAVTPTPQDGSEYEKCLAGAGSDIAAAQRCAALVGR